MTEQRRPVFKIASRPGTQDEQVAREVLGANQYRLPAKFTEHDNILDVGAHIGIFAVSCMLRGAGRVHCYEPDEANFALLKENMDKLPGARARKLAIWRSDIPSGKLLFSGYPPEATACGSVLPGCSVGSQNQQIPVLFIGLDAAIHRLAGDHGRIRLLKIDAEGSEYPALYTSTRLHQIDEIVGECHEWTLGAHHNDVIVPPHENTMIGLADFLKSQGFTNLWYEREGARRGGVNWLFWAHKPRTV